MNHDTTVKTPTVTTAEAVRNMERRIAWLYQKRGINHGWLSAEDAAELKELEAKLQKVKS